MAKTIEQIRKYLDKARQVEAYTNTLALEYKRKVEEETRKIEDNPDLSGEGKYKAKNAMKQRLGIELLQDAYRLKQLYRAELTKARQAADEIVYKKPSAPDKTRLERFSDELKALKTELMLTSRGDTAQQKLKAFIDKHINGPQDRFFANMLREEFQELAAPILEISGENREKLRGQLRELFERLDSSTLTDEARSARGVLDLTTSMLERDKIFSLIASDSMSAAVGPEFSRFLNEPEKFFEDKPELRPEDYVDPEMEKEKAEKARDEMWENLGKILKEKAARGELNL